MLTETEITSVEGVQGLEFVNSWRVLQDLAPEIKLDPANLEKLSKFITEEGMDLTKLKNSLGNAKDAQKWIDMKIPQKELDEIFVGIANDPPSSFIPWTKEHKAQRWNNYKAGKEAGENSGQNFETWSNGYDGKIDLVTNAKKGVDDYFEALNWGCPVPPCRERLITDITAVVDGKVIKGGRRLDIADVQAKKAKEFKEYSSEKVYNSADIRREVAMDKALLVTKQMNEIEWVFKGCKPSGPLEKALKGAKIKINLIP